MCGMKTQKKKIKLTSHPLKKKLKNPYQYTAR